MTAMSSHVRYVLLDHRRHFLYTVLLPVALLLVFSRKSSSLYTKEDLR